MDGKATQQTLESILLQTEDIISFNRGAIFIRRGNSLTATVAKNYHPKDILKYKIGEGLIGYAAQTGEVIYTKDIKKESWEGKPMKPARLEAQTYQDIKTAYLVPLIINGKKKRKVIGVLELVSEKYDAFDETERKMLEIVAGYMATSIERTQLEAIAKNHMIELIRAWGLTYEKQDPYLEGHSKRVAQISKKIAKKMGFDKEFIYKIHLAGLLHDIGRVDMPSEILRNLQHYIEQAFYGDENPMRIHAQLGYDLTAKYHFSYKRFIRDVILSHHEKMDGSGYPRSLKGNKISRAARIMAVADIFDALTSPRPYRKAKGEPIKYSSKQALGIMKRMTNQLDPEAFEVLLRLNEHKKL